MIQIPICCNFPFFGKLEERKTEQRKEKLNFKLANQPAAATNNKTPNVIWQQNRRKLRKLNMMAEVFVFPWWRRVVGRR